jgi:Trk-type K+ transport system membrane component
VGLSLGADDPALPWASFSYDVSTASKLVLIAVMVVGRTRGYPLRVDGALTLSLPDQLAKDTFLRPDTATTTAAATSQDSSSATAPQSPSATVSDLAPQPA